MHKEQLLIIRELLIGLKKDLESLADAEGHENVVVNRETLLNVTNLRIAGLINVLKLEAGLPTEEQDESKKVSLDNIDDHINIEVD